MKQIYYLLFLVMLASCSSLKQAEKSINAGDYTQAYDILLKEYKSGLSNKKKAKFLPIFQKAYMRMVSTEEAKIAQLKSANNPAYAGEIFETIVGLHQRQEKLRPILPIYNNGREMVFKTKNYLPAIESAKKDYVEYLYATGVQNLNSSYKSDIRNAYHNFLKIDQLIPGYKDIRSLKEQAHNLGSDLVLIEIQNKTNQMIPRRLERDLTQIDTYGLGNFWTVYHEKEQANLSYDYLIRMDIQNILVSPERMNSRVHDFNREIKDGWEYLYENGRKVLDSLGNPIQVDRYINISARVEEVTQEKDALLEGSALLIDLKNDQIIDRQRLHSEFGFRNHFAKVFGDPRALDRDMYKLSRQQFIPFPSHEQMVYDTGEDVKNQLKVLLKRRFN